MQFSPQTRTFLAWFLLSCLAVGTCALIWPAAHFGDEFVPVGNDSFYHARRILDTAADPSAFYEFDPNIHAPEGSLLTWPWGYDYVLGRIVRAGVQLGISSDPMAILVWIPTATVLISMGLLVLIARRLSMSLWATALAGVCFALLPLTQYLHGVGFIDHHYAEHIFVLATLCTSLVWFANPQSIGPAIALGTVLGLAPAVHNAMFVLQIPVLLAVFTWWLQGIQIPRRPVHFFSAALLATTLLILIPSEPFREGMFEYFLLSWFQLYIAAGTVVAFTYFSYFNFSGRSITTLGLLGLALIAPLGYQISAAQDFLVGDLTRLETIGEMMSITRLMNAYGPLDVTNRYSAFVWLIPATGLLCCYYLWRERETANAIFWIFSILGLILMTMQFRLHYFGSYALYLPWLLLVDRLASERSEVRAKIMLGASLTVLLIYSFPMRNQLLGPMPVGNDLYFRNLHPVLIKLREECSKEPGVVLTDNDAGHYIRFYTDCPVIANNFLLTAQHGQKVEEMDRLLSLTAIELPLVAPHVRYVLVRPASIVPQDGDTVQYMSFSPESSHLVGDLLLKPYGESGEIPQVYELLHEAVLSGEQYEIDYPYARLYRIGSRAEPASGIQALSGG